jgi:hypothetical protein
MKIEELMAKFHLTDKHVEQRVSVVPVLEPGIYNILGKELYELYKKYGMEEQDQRRLEGICYLLQSFTVYQQSSMSSRSWVDRVTQVWKEKKMERNRKNHGDSLIQ